MSLSRRMSSDTQSGWTGMNGKSDFGGASCCRGGTGAVVDLRSIR